MKRWRPLIVRGSLLLMESLWVYAFVAVFVAITVGGGKPSFFGTAAVVIASFAISRGLQGFDISLGVLRAWGVMLSVLVFYAIVRIDFYGDFRLWDFTFLDVLINDTEASMRDEATAVIGVPVLWLFWMRGVLRGQQAIEFDDVVRSFAVGVIVVAAAQLFGSMSDELPRAVDFVAVPYLAVGLIAIGLAHASRASDEFERSFAPVWLLSIGGAVAALAFFALLFVLIDFQTAQAAVAWTARGIGYIIAGIFYVAVWPILKLVELGFDLIRWLTEVYGGERPEPPEFEPGEGEFERPEEGESTLPGWVGTLVRVVVGGGLIAAFLGGMALLFSRLKKAPRPGELKESTYQEGRLASDLGNLLGSVLGRFRPGLHFGGETEPARRLYFEMLAAAEKKGIQRRPMETPLDVEPRISRAFGAETPSEITRLFDDVRYGGLAPPAPELRRLREEWERLPK